MSEIKTCEQYVLAELESAKLGEKAYREAWEKETELAQKDIAIIKFLIKQFDLRYSTTDNTPYFNTSGIWKKYEPDEFKNMAKLMLQFGEELDKEVIAELEVASGLKEFVDDRAE